MMTTGDMCIVKKLFVMFGYVIFDICEWTDRQTYTHADRQTDRHIDMLIAILHHHPGVK